MSKHHPPVKLVRRLKFPNDWLDLVKEGIPEGVYLMREWGMEEQYIPAYVEVKPVVNGYWLSIKHLTAGVIDGATLDKHDWEFIGPLDNDEFAGIINSVPTKIGRQPEQ